MNEILVLSTCATTEEADRIARYLVEQQLAACVNILPGVRSIYRWQGKVEEADEILLLIKTHGHVFEPLKAAVAELHSYDVPELIALPITDGSQPYLNWLRDQLRPR